MKGNKVLEPQMLMTLKEMTTTMIVMLITMMMTMMMVMMTVMMKIMTTLENENTH